jgi:hypothetical protein
MKFPTFAMLLPYVVLAIVSATRAQAFFLPLQGTTHGTTNGNQRVFLPSSESFTFVKPLSMVLSSTFESVHNNTSCTESDPQNHRRGYQRIEEWDEEEKTKGVNAWGQKVQFDGQRFGNQVRQNDILQRHLHSF